MIDARAIGRPLQSRIHPEIRRGGMCEQGLKLPPTALTVNGHTHWPALRYIGGFRNGCRASDWKPNRYGTKLSLSGSGDAPTLNRNSTQFSQGQIYSGNAELNVGLDTDLYFEAVIHHNQQSTSLAIMDMISVAGGFRFLSTPNGLELWLIDSESNTKTATTGVLLNGYCFVTGILSRATNSLVIYHNTSSKTPIDVSAFGAMSYSGPLTLGGAVPPIWQYDSAIAYLALYSASNWLDTHIQDALVAKRFAAINLNQFAI